MKKLLLLSAIIILSFIAFTTYKYLPLIAPAISAQGKTAMEITKEHNRLNSDLASALRNEGVVDSAIINSLTAPIEEQPSGGSDSSDTTGTASGVASNEKTHKLSDRDTIINTHLKQIEKFKASYSKEIVGLMQNAKAEYRSLPPEQKNSNAITSIGFKYADKALAMEASADQRYQNILNTLEKELTAAGLSTNVVGEMQSYYKSFKEVQKENYIAEIIAASKK